MEPEVLRKQLCNTFCGSVDVRAVPMGLAVRSAFEDTSGDPIQFYITRTADGLRVEDDGAYLSHLIASDVPIDQGQRGQLLDAILQQGGAFWDRESFEIRSLEFPETELSKRVVSFMSSLIRVRDLELLTREVVRSTFREDVIAAVTASFGAVANIEEDAALDPDLAEFPADIVIRPKGAGLPGAVYLVNSNDKLNEALLAQTETQMLRREDVKVIALVEEPDMKLISRRRFQRAQNRSLAMPIFRGDEDAAMRMIARGLKLPLGSVA